MSLPQPVPPKIQALYDSMEGACDRKMLEVALTQRGPNGYAVTAEDLASAFDNAVSETTIKRYRRTVVNNQETE